MLQEGVLGSVSKARALGAPIYCLFIQYIGGFFRASGALHLLACRADLRFTHFS